MMKRALLLCAVCLVGCEIRDPNPYLGKWNGRFRTSESGGETGKELARNDLVGYLQIYGTQNRFELHLTGEQHGVHAKGEWTSEKDRITLRSNSLNIDDNGGEQRRRMDRKYITADAIRAAYGSPIVLRLSKDKQSLVGMDTEVGKLVGVHEFSKISNRYTY